MNDDHAPPGENSPDNTSPEPARAADERFAASLRRLLDSSGMSQGELARRMSAAGWPWHQQTVARILAGKRTPGIGEGDAVARILGTNIPQMLLPGPEAAVTADLEMFTAVAFRAHAEITRRAAELADAQLQLRRAVADAEAQDWFGSAVVRKLAGDAERAVQLDPRAAAGEIQQDRG